MSKLALSIALATAFVASAAGAPVKEMHADGFSVQMPGTPEVARNSVRVPGGNAAVGSWTSAVDGILYSISYTDYPAAYAASQGAEKMLSDSAQGLANQLRGVLKAERALTLAGHPGKAYTVDSDNGEAHARNYVVGARVYTLLVLFNPSLGADAERFLNSLKLDQAAK